MRELMVKLVDIATKVTRWLVILAAVCMGILMFVNFFDVMGTKFFGKSIPGSLDISEELMVFMTLLPIAYIALERGHIRVTLFDRFMTPRIRFIINISQYFIAVIITAIITWRVFVHFLKTFRLVQLKEGIDLPIWPSNLAVVISFFILTLVWMILLGRTLVAGIEK